jgi:hypothetical protein
LGGGSGPLLLQERLERGRLVGDGGERHGHQLPALYRIVPLLLDSRGGLDRLRQRIVERAHHVAMQAAVHR